MTGCGHRAKPSGGNQADRIPSLAVMRTSRLSLRRSSIFSQPAEKEDINEGGDKRKNPGKHLRKPSRIETVHIARIGRSARLSTGNAAGKLDSERDLRMGAPKPVRHRGRKNNQQQRKQSYAAFLWRYGLHFFSFRARNCGQAESDWAEGRKSRIEGDFLRCSPASPPGE
jgi:hypothetical protein